MIQRRHVLAGALAAPFVATAQAKQHVMVVGGGFAGLSTALHAAEAGLRICPHRGAELWGLHALAALDPDPLAETGRPWMTWVAGQPPVRDGVIELPDRPGFGATFDESTLQVM